MSLVHIVHIQSKESREKIINQFCKLLAIPSFCSVFIYLYLQVYTLAALTGFIGSVFLLFVYLNKKGHFGISRAAIITVTNAGIFFFSIYLGFNSGIYLYFFVASLLIYLLFDFSEKKLIYAFILLYLLTFLLIAVFDNYYPPLNTSISPKALKFIYAFNFCVALIFCFGFVAYFANNNNQYIASLIQHQELLVQEVSLRNKSEELVKKNLHERELLLAEIHHRVKNNLAIVSALINMQIGKLKEEGSREIFEDTKNRIYAMSLIHNLLYRNKSFSKINFVEYVDSFCANAAAGYSSQNNITIEQFVDESEPDIKTAIPLALILNEIITNSFKHAFKDGVPGKIRVELKNNNDHYIFRISDNGIGMNEQSFNSGSMGIDIIKSLAEQIDAKVDYKKDGGSNYTFTIPVV
ncbi:MAG: sensor histidine kinase [Bacteroidia bacterium]